MFVRLVKLSLVTLLLSGCASTSTKQQVNNCAPKFQLEMGDSLYLAPPLATPSLKKHIDKINSKSDSDEVVVVELVKGYVKIYNMVLEGHAVLKIRGEDAYFRGADTDSNMANTDGEWRSVFNKALKSAFIKAQHQYSACSSNV